MDRNTAEPDADALPGPNAASSPLDAETDHPLLSPLDSTEREIELGAGIFLEAVEAAASSTARR